MTKRKRIPSLLRNRDDTVRARIYEYLREEGGRRGEAFGADVFLKTSDGYTMRDDVIDEMGDFFCSKQEALEWVEGEYGPMKGYRLPPGADTYTHGWPRENPVSKRHLQDTRDVEKDVTRVERGETTKYFVRAGRQSVDISGQPVTWVGCVVNPKTLRPYFVARWDQTHRNAFFVYVPTMLKERVEMVAEGYFQDNDDGEYAVPALVTGYPRIHTVSGVSEQGEGLGTVLYTAGSMVGAYYNVVPDENNIEREMLSGAGCSSGNGASSAAAAWWARAVELGLAEEEEGDYETEGEVEAEEEITVHSYAQVNVEEMFHNSRGQQDAQEQIAEQAFEEDHSSEVSDSVDFSVDDYSLGRVSTPEASDYGVEVTAVFSVTWESEEEEEEQSDDFEATIVVNVDWAEATHDEIMAELESEAQDYFERHFDTLKITLVEVRRITKLSPGYVDVTYSIDIEVTGTREGGGSESAEVFYYPFSNAVVNGLVLDVNESLERENPLWSGIGPEKLLEVVLALDLSEVEDPTAMRWFFALAESLGASTATLWSFRNSVLAYRGDLPAETGDPPYNRDIWAQLGESGYRINPSDKAGKAHEIFGDLADL